MRTFGLTEVNPRCGLLAVVLLLSAACPVHAQPNRFEVVQRVARDCPGLVLQDHAFTDATASVLHLEDARWGRNGKRGNVNDPSHDAIAYRDPTGPGGVRIFDIIAAAGGPDARPAWQDVTQATIAAGTVGAWVAPSGALPKCLGGVVPPPPPVAPPITPQPPLVLPDMTEVLVELSRIENRLTALERAMDAHAVDAKERADVIRVTLEQLTAWLRGRSVLRW